jgi:hypothetical protein
MAERGAGGGIGIMLGAGLLPDYSLGGLDLDRCRDPRTGAIAPWARALIRAFGSYWEVSPSGTGVKIYFWYRSDYLGELRQHMDGALHGKKWARPARAGDAGHAPAIELHLGNRYFCVTWLREGFDDAADDADDADELRIVPVEQLLELIRDIGPAFAGGQQEPKEGRQRTDAAPPHQAGDSADADDTLPQRIRRASRFCQTLRRRWEGDWSGLKDQTASARAMALGSALKRVGFTFADMCAGLRLHRDTATWTREKGDPVGGRELHRLWDKAADLAAEDPEQEPIFLIRDTFPDEGAIPPRPWIVPGCLIRRAVTMPFGPPDQGKTLLLIAWAVALALGRPWGRFAPVGRMRVLLVLSEEDDDEQSRRFSAALRAFGATHAQIEPYVRRLVVRDLATLLTVNADTGEIVPASGWTELRSAIIDFRADVVALDPLAEFHTAEENHNTLLKAVIARFRDLAREFNLAALVSHHARKGVVVPGELEQLRGASAIGAAARIAFTVVEMSREEADSFGISQAGRRYFLRVDPARGSYAAPASEAEWLEKQGFVLDNGDEAPALLPWQPPEARTPDQATLARLITAIGKGCPEADGAPWSPQLRNGEARSVRRLFQRHGVNRVSEQPALQALRDMGVVQARYRTARRDVRLGLRTPDGLPPVSWEAAP